jgi:hypothetical protein
MEPRAETQQGWQPRPGFAALLRAFVLIAPIAASVAFVHVASQIIGPPEHDVTVGSVSRTVPAGHELRIGLYVTSGDQWVAMTSSFPSSLELSVP